MHLFVAFMFVALTTFLMGSEVSAQVYLLRPHGEKAVDVPSLLLSDQDQTNWLQSFYKQLSPRVSSTAKELKDEEGQSVEDKIQHASQNYLELDPAKTNQVLEQALFIVAQSFPY